MKIKDYVLQDVKWHYSGNGVFKLLARFFANMPYRYCILLRMTQLCKLCGGGYKRFCGKLNISVPSDIKAGEGLCFPHGFPLVINGGVEIGRFVTISPNVLIGGNRKVGKCPIIGDYCYIGNGVKIIGKVKVGNWCFLAPGAVITKDIPDDSVVGFGLNNIISQNGRARVSEYLSKKIKDKISKDERNNGN